MNAFDYINELVKEAASAVAAGRAAPITDDEAEKAYDQLQSLEKARPSRPQIQRYAALGAVAGPTIGAISDVIKGQAPLGYLRRAAGGTGFRSQIKPMARNLAGNATAGALSSGAVPLVRAHLDRKAHMGTLQNYVNQYENNQPAGAVQPPPVPSV